MFFEDCEVWVEGHLISGQPVKAYNVGACLWNAVPLSFVSMSWTVGLCSLVCHGQPHVSEKPGFLSLKKNRGFLPSQTFGTTVDFGQG